MVKQDLLKVETVVNRTAGMIRTLIVDDNETYRETLRNLLSTGFSNMTFNEAEDGSEILKKINTFRPDLIFMDINLPGESGLDLTKKIKSSHADIIVIIITSYDFPEYREVADLHGANHFLSKGCSTAEEILALVNSILKDLGKSDRVEKEGNQDKSIPIGDNRGVQ